MGLGGWGVVGEGGVERRGETRREEERESERGAAGERLFCARSTEGGTQQSARPRSTAKRVFRLSKCKSVEMSKVIACRREDSKTLLQTQTRRDGPGSRESGTKKSDLKGRRVSSLDRGSTLCSCDELLSCWFSFPPAGAVYYEPSLSRKHSERRESSPRERERAARRAWGVAGCPAL